MIRAFLVVLTALHLVLPAAIRADDGGARDAARLVEKYRVIEGRLKDNAFHLPLYLEPADSEGQMRGDVYGIIDRPFATVAQVLGMAATWCDIIPLHFNVKACTHRRLDGRYLLTLYSGRKFYEPAESTYRLQYEYVAKCMPGSYCKVTLTAAEGPLDTGDYAFVIEAIPLDSAGTFIHFRYSYRYGVLTSILTAGYFATLGRDKIGFSVTGSNDAGDPAYVKGTQGVIERNSVRYYLAVKAYLDTMDTPQAARFEQRAGYWFDLTDRYRTQLFEMEKAEYLTYKRRERADQVRLQQALDGNAGGNPQAP